MGKYKVYKEFQYKGRRITAQKTGIYKSGNNAYIFQLRNTKGKWLDSFHIFDKNYTSAKVKAKEYMRKHSKELNLK